MGYLRVCVCMGAGVCEEIRFNLLIWLDLGHFVLEIRCQYYCTGFCFGLASWQNHEEQWHRVRISLCFC